MTDFKPPIDNPLVVALTKLLFPLELRTQRLRVNVQQGAENIFKELKGRRTVILVNHPDGQDPYAIFGLSKLVGENFYYLAALDVFGVGSRFYSWYGQNMGCYSIDRSCEFNREAIKMTISLLKRNKRKIVIFPEGELTGKDYGLASIKEGTIHLILKAQERVAPEPIFVLPIGIHYKLSDPKVVTNAIKKLERHLKIRTPSTMSQQNRLQKLIEITLKRIQVDLQIKGGSSLSHSQQAIAAGSAIVHQVLEQARLADENIDLDANAEPLTLLYKLRSSYVQDKNSGKISWDRLKMLQRAEKLLFLSRLLEEEHMPENEYRIIQCLNYEITGNELPKTWRYALISIGTPVNSLDFLEEYSSDKDISKAAGAITTAMKQTVGSRRLRAS